MAKSAWDEIKHISNALRNRASGLFGQAGRSVQRRVVNPAVVRFGQSPVGRGLVNIQRFGESSKPYALPQSTYVTPKQQPKRTARYAQNTPRIAYNVGSGFLSSTIGAGIMDPLHDVGRLTVSAAQGKQIPAYNTLKSAHARAAYNVMGINRTPQQVVGNVAGVALPVISAYAPKGTRIVAGNAIRQVGRMGLLPAASRGAQDAAKLAAAYGAAHGLSENRNAPTVGRQVLQAGKEAAVTGAVGGLLGGTLGAGSYSLGALLNVVKKQQPGISTKDARKFIESSLPRDKKSGRFVIKPPQFMGDMRMKAGVSRYGDDVPLQKAELSIEMPTTPLQSKPGLSGAQQTTDLTTSGKPVSALGDSIPPSGPPGQPPSYTPPSSPDDSVQRVIGALTEAKPIRGQQEQIYTKARGEKLARVIAVGQRVKGEKGFYAQLGQLKGELPKVQYETLRNKIGQEDIDNIFNKVSETDIASEWEKITAKQGLAKLFGAEGGTVPTQGELQLLNRIFGKDFTKAVLSNRSTFQKLGEAGQQLFNLPRSLMASVDLSAPLRQGFFMLGRPKRFTQAFGSMFKQAASEQGFKDIQMQIYKRPTYQQMAQNKLAIMNIDDFLTSREEAFMSNWGEKIPVAGKLIRASNRGYTGFLNKLRADVFDDFVAKGKALGIDDPTYLKDAADFINNATGRGSLGKMERAAIALNGIFFSPRLFASRINLLNPLYYGSLQPQVRKEALKTLLGTASVVGSVLALAKMGGAEVGTDPRSADFGKLKAGNTRYDVMGGFQQYIRLASQLTTGKIVSSSTGLTTTLGEGYKPVTRLDILSRFAEAKTAPVLSFALGLLKGRDAIGQPFNVPQEIAQRFYPIVIQDLQDLYKEKGLEGIAMGSPAIFGVGTQTYESKPLSQVQRSNAKKEIIDYYLEGDRERARDLVKRHELTITKKEVKTHVTKKVMDLYLDGFIGNDDRKIGEARSLLQTANMGISKKAAQKAAKQRAIDLFLQGDQEGARKLQAKFKFTVSKKEIYGPN